MANAVYEHFWVCYCKAYSEHVITESQNSNDVTKARTKTWRNFSKKVRLVESMHVQLEFFLIVLNMDSSLLASSTSTVVWQSSKLFSSWKIKSLLVNLPTPYTRGNCQSTSCLCDLTLRRHSNYLTQAELGSSFLWLAHLSKHYILKIHPGHSTCQNFLFKDWIVFKSKHFKHNV